MSKSNDYDGRRPEPPYPTSEDWQTLSASELSILERKAAAWDFIISAFGRFRWDGTIGRPSTFQIYVPPFSVPDNCKELEAIEALVASYKENNERNRQT